MSGVRDSDLKQKLLSLNPFPDLQTVLSIARSHESAMRNVQDLNKSKVEKVKKTNLTWKEKKNRNFNKDKTRCFCCG